MLFFGAREETLDMTQQGEIFVGYLEDTIRCRNNVAGRKFPVTSHGGVMGKSSVTKWWIFQLCLITGGYSIISQAMEAVYRQKGMFMSSFLQGGAL